MPSPSIPHSPAELLAVHAGWIRELARHMVADSNTADDLAQEACVVALGRAPRDRNAFRPWLAAVMRNLLRQRSRGELRRYAREERAARGEAQDAADRLVERVELERELVASVLELDEPYRSAILLRFFDDLPPREIARRLAVPVNTVHSRLARGLARLRERLDAAHGDRRAWSIVLLPLAAKPKLVSSVTLGSWLMNTKAVVALSSAVLLVSALAVVALQRERPLALQPASDAGERLAAAPEIDASPARGMQSDAGAPARVPALVGVEATRAQAVATEAAPIAAPYTVRGRVLDEQGVGLAGVAIEIEGDEAATGAAASLPRDGTRSATDALADLRSGAELRSGLGGRFEFETSALHGRVQAKEARWATVRGSTYRRGSSLESVLVVAPAIDVAGRIEDASGAPLPNARVEVLLPRGFDTRFGDVLEASYPIGWRARADERGEFALARVASVQGASLVALLEGYEPATSEFPAGSARDLVLVMRRPEVPLSGALRGQVVDPSGAPVAGARVGGGLASTTSGERGEFTLDLARAVTCTSVTALHPRFLPATLSRPEEPREGETGWPDFIVLRLAGEPLAIEGRVVDADERPLAGMRVWLADPTPFGAIGRVPFQVEGLLSGEPVPSFVVRTEPRAGDEDGDNFNDSWMQVGPPTALWYWTATGDDGRFRFPGLVDREYRLEIMDTQSFVRFTSDPIRAGSKGVEIEMPRPNVHARFVGVVKSDDGQPVAGVRVNLGGAPYRVRARVFGGTSEVVMVEQRDSTTTDADGRFEFANVPADRVGLEFTGEGIVPDQRWITPDVDPARYEVELHTRCNLRVELSPPLDRADAVAVRDGDGKPLDVMVLDQGGTNAYTDVRLVDGKSRVVAVSSAAKTLVLMKAGAVVETHPLVLSRDDVNVLRP